MDCVRWQISSLLDKLLAHRRLILTAGPAQRLEAAPPQPPHPILNRLSLEQRAITLLPRGHPLHLIPKHNLIPNLIIPPTNHHPILHFRAQTVPLQRPLQFHQEGPRRKKELQ